MKYNVGDRVITKYLPDIFGLDEVDPNSLDRRVSCQECTVVSYITDGERYVLAPDDERLAVFFKNCSFDEEWIEPIPVKELFVPKQEAILNFIM